MTKRLMQDALIDLLSEKPIHKVTVRELCERADVNRSTFYAHYASPYDILSELEVAIIDRTISYLDEASDRNTHRNALIKLLKFYESHRNLYLLLLSNTQDGCYVDNLTKAAGSWISNFNAPSDKKLPPDLSAYRWNFNTAGSVKLVRDWLKSDPRISPAEMAEILMRLCENK